MCAQFGMLEYLEEFNGLNGKCNAQLDAPGGTCVVDEETNTCKEHCYAYAQHTEDLENPCTCECVKPGTCKARKQRGRCRLVEKNCNVAQGFSPDADLEQDCECKCIKSEN